MRAMLQLAPNELATPHSHRPSGDQVNCWKKPWRCHLRTTCFVATSMKEMPLIDRHTICLPSGLQLAQGYSPVAAEDLRVGAVAAGKHQLALRAVAIIVDRLAAGHAAIEQPPAVAGELR